MVEKTDDGDYTYELQSNWSTSRRLNAMIATGIDPRISCRHDPGWLLFEERVDLRFGLLDKLLVNGVLNEVEYGDVKDCRSSTVIVRLVYKKLFESVELAGRRSAYVNSKVVLALKSTRQQHLLNYVWNYGVYNPRFGGEWPLADRQMMTLNVNQEVLVELMDMSPELNDQLYSRNVLNKRHKDYICGQLSAFKRSETFLDILRRRSFKDYKETIKCLRASNQKHIADVLDGGVVMRILCTLKRSKRCTMNRTTTETLVERFSEELKIQSVDGEDMKFQLTKIGLIDVKFDNAIVLYFKCKTKDDLTNLKKAFDNHEMKTMAERDFLQLFSCDDRPLTAMFEWIDEDYKICNNYLHSRPEIHELPAEVLEIILTKTYAVYFSRVQPRPREKELFAMLSSVSQDWHRNAVRPRFKKALNRRLSPYFLSIRNRQTIVRSNRQYFIEKMEPSSNLIRRLENVGCLTSEEANYIESLQHSREKNHELLTVASKLSFKKHSNFVESLHVCGQQKVANVLEKGGVVLKTMATCAGTFTDGDFIKRINDNISNTQMKREYRKFVEFNGPNFELWKKLEMLEVQPVAKRKRKAYVVIWLWYKSQKLLRHLRELAKSDQLLKRMDILMKYIESKDIKHFRFNLNRSGSIVQSLQFLKTLTLHTTPSQRTVAVRQMSMKFSEEFNLPPLSRAFTSLDDKIYVLTDDLISIHQYMTPYAQLSNTAFPPDPGQSQTLYTHYRVDNWLIEACNQTKCLYVNRSNDKRVWKLKTPGNNLEVWMIYMADLCSLSVTSSGSVLILKIVDGETGLHDSVYFLEIYTKDAVLLYSINLDVPLYNTLPESSCVMEISPGNFAIRCQQVLFVKSVNFETQTTTDQNLVQYSGVWPQGATPMALFSMSRLIAVLPDGLAVFDSRLNLDILSYSFNERGNGLHYRKDKRQTMVWSSGMQSVRIYTLQYDGEDMLPDDV